MNTLLRFRMLLAAFLLAAGLPAAAVALTFTVNSSNGNWGNVRIVDTDTSTNLGDQTSWSTTFGSGTVRHFQLVAQPYGDEVFRGWSDPNNLLGGNTSSPTINVTVSGTATLTALFTYKPYGDLMVNDANADVAITYGQGVDLLNQLNTPEGTLVFHTFLWDQGNGSMWTSPQFTYGGYAANGTGWSSISNSNGSVGNPFQNIITAWFTPQAAGTFIVRSHGNDDYGGVAARNHTITVAKATPQFSNWSDRTFGSTSSTYTVLAGDLQAIAANPFGTQVPAPTVSYSFAGGGAIAAGTALTAGTYTIRASSGGGSNYNAVTKDVVWIVLANRPTYTLTLQSTPSIITQFTVQGAAVNANTAVAVPAGGDQLVVPSAPAAVPSGYTFGGWSVTSGTASIDNAGQPGTYMRLSSNATLQARYVPNVTVTLGSSNPSWGFVHVVDTDTNVYYGGQTNWSRTFPSGSVQHFRVTAQAYDNCIFMYWNDPQGLLGGNVTNPVANIAPSAAATLNARFTYQPYGSLLVNGSDANASLTFGQSVSLQNQLNTPEGTLTFHSFLWDQGVTGSAWVSPQFTYNGLAANPAGWSNISNTNGIVGNPFQNVITATFAPPSAGTFAVRSIGTDNYGGAAIGTHTLTVARANPAISNWANRTFVAGASNYVVQATDLGAVFANPYSASAVGPTGVGYTIVGGSALTAGSTLAPGTYTVRASTGGDGNYNAAQQDVTWTINPPGAVYSVIVQSSPAIITGFKVQGSAQAPNASFAVNGGGDYLIAANTPAAVPAGYTFNGWTVASGSATIATPSSPSSYIRFSSNATVVANYVPNTVIAVASSNAAWGAVQIQDLNSGWIYWNQTNWSRTFASGTAQPLRLTALPYGDEVFMYWLDPNGVISGSTANPQVDIAPTNGATVTARFTYKPYGDLTVTGANLDASVSFGQSVALRNQLNTPEATLVFHTFLWDQGSAGGPWVSPQFTYGGNPADGAGWSAISNTNGAVGNAFQNVITATFTPQAAGTFVVRAYGNDNYSGVAAHNHTITVAKATPTIANWSNRSLLNTLTNELSATLSNPNGGSVPAPTGSIAYTVVSSSAGVAFGTVLHSGDTIPPGSYTVRASYSGNANYNATSADVAWTVSLPPQSINFGTLVDKTYGDAAFNVSASASSGLPVSFIVTSGPATVSGSLVTITGAGSVTITARQSGNASWAPAPDVSRTFTVAKATATVTLSNLAFTYDGNGHGASASTSPGGLSVGLTYNGGGALPVGAGSYAVVGTINDANYQGSGSATLTVAKATASVTLGTTAPTYDGTAKTASATTNPSGLSVGFTYNASSAAPTNAGSYALVGTVNDANYQGSSSGTFTINKAAASVALGALAQTYTGSPRVATAVTTPGGLTVNFTYDGSSTAPTNVGSYAVVGTISATNYQGTASETLTVSKAAQAISFAPLPRKALGDPAFSPGAFATSGLAISYVSSNQGVATVSGSNLTIVGSGTSNITASQAGNANYFAASDVTQQLTVLTGQTVNFAALPQHTIGDDPFALSATASSGLPVTFSSSDASVATVSGSTVTIVGIGSAAITAAQAGNATYQAASTARTLVVNANTPPVVTLTGPEEITVGQQVSVGMSVTDVNGNLVYWKLSLLPGNANPTPINSDQSTSFSIQHSIPGTYIYVLEAGDKANAVTQTSLVVNVSDVSPPQVPSNVAVSQRTLTSFHLSWAAPSDDVGAVAYEVSYTSGESVIETEATDVEIGELLPGTTYSFQVRAKDAAGNWSGWSSPYSAATLADTSAPTTPGNLQVPSAEQRPTYEMLYWDASTDNVAVTGYNICIALEGHPSTAVYASTTGTSYALAGLQPATTYYVKVQAFDDAGNVSPWTNEVFTVTPPEFASNQPKPAWDDVNGDGIRDQILPSGVNAAVTYDFAFWDFYSGYYNNWDPFDYWNFFGTYTDDGFYYPSFQSIWYWDYAVYYPVQAQFDVSASFYAEAGYDYGIFRDSTGNATIVPSALEVLESLIHGGLGGWQYWGLGTYLDYELYNVRFYTVRYSFAPASVTVSAGGTPSTITLKKTPVGAQGPATAMGDATDAVTPIEVVLNQGLKVVLDSLNNVLGGSGRNIVWTAINMPEKTTISIPNGGALGALDLGISRDGRIRIGLQVDDDHNIYWFEIVVRQPKPLKIIAEPIARVGSQTPPKNPAGFEVGTQATFEVSFPWREEPKNLNDISWTVTGPATFVGSNKGKSVVVQGSSAGAITLQVQVANRSGPIPQFTSTVFTKNTVPVIVYVLANKEGRRPAATQAEVTTWLNEANQIWKQAAMEFVQQGAIVPIADNTFLSPTTEQQVQDLFNTHHGAPTHAVELYFTRGLPQGWSGGTNNTGSAINVSARTAKTLAHELGHACGLADIYIHRDADSAHGITAADLDSGRVRQAWLELDWPGGPGPEYYKRDLDQTELVSERLLMYGNLYQSTTRAIVLPRGPVRGVPSGNSPVGSIKVGLYHGTASFSDMNRQPESQ